MASGAQPRASAAGRVYSRGVIVRSELFDATSGECTHLTLAQLFQQIAEKEATQVEIHESLFGDLLKCTESAYRTVVKIQLTGSSLGASGSPIDDENGLISFLTKLCELFPNAKLYYSEGQIFSSSYADTNELTKATGMPFAQFKKCSKSTQIQESLNSSGALFDLEL